MPIIKVNQEAYLKLRQEREKCLLQGERKSLEQIASELILRGLE